jgi:hypothetical protein
MFAHFNCMLKGYGLMSWETGRHWNVRFSLHDAVHYKIFILDIFISPKLFYRGRSKGYLLLP